jgi:hypothetical protein
LILAEVAEPAKRWRASKNRIHGDILLDLTTRSSVTAAYHARAKKIEVFKFLSGPQSRFCAYSGAIYFAFFSPKEETKLFSVALTSSD